MVAVSLANMGSLELPDAISKVIIAADNDGDNQGAVAQLDRAIANFQNQGKTVCLARAPEGHKDMNALAMAGGE